MFASQGQGFNNTSNSIGKVPFRARHQPQLDGFMEPIGEEGDAQDEYEAIKA